MIDIDQMDSRGDGFPDKRCEVIGELRQIERLRLWLLFLKHCGFLRLIRLGRPGMATDAATFICDDSQLVHHRAKVSLERLRCHDSSDASGIPAGINAG
jgi:hypothetical protein